MFIVKPPTVNPTHSVEETPKIILKLDLDMILSLSLSFLREKIIVLSEDHFILYTNVSFS